MTERLCSIFSLISPISTTILQSPSLQLPLLFPLPVLLILPSPGPLRFFTSSKLFSNRHRIASNNIFSRRIIFEYFIEGDEIDEFINLFFIVVCFLIFDFEDGVLVVGGGDGAGFEAFDGVFVGGEGGGDFEVVGEGGGRVVFCFV